MTSSRGVRHPVVVDRQDSEPKQGLAVDPLLLATAGVAAGVGLKVATNLLSKVAFHAYVTRLNRKKKAKGNTVRDQDFLIDGVEVRNAFPFWDVFEEERTTVRVVSKVKRFRVHLKEWK